MARIIYHLSLDDVADSRIKINVDIFIGAMSYLGYHFSDDYEFIHNLGLMRDIWDELPVLDRDVIQRDIYNSFFVPADVEIVSVRQNSRYSFIVIGECNNVKVCSDILDRRSARTK